MRALLVVMAALLTGLACSRLVSDEAVVQHDFEKAMEVILPDLTPTQAREVPFLTETSPSQFDGQLGRVFIQCTFEGEHLVLGRVGTEGTILSEKILPRLIELHGEPSTLEDSWSDPSGNVRSERKWAFPNQTDLVEHDAYVPRKDEDPEKAMPSETVLRVGG